MKKRIFALFLAVCLSVTGILLASCQKEPTAEELLKKASLKTAALDAYSAVMEMKLDMNMLGMSMEIPVTVDIKVKNPLVNPTVSAAYDMSVLGQQMKMDLYMEDGWMYMAIAETEYTEAEKYKTNVAEILSQYDFTSDVQDLMKDLPADLLADVVPVKNEDGSRTVSLAVPKEIFNEVYADLVAEMGETGGAVGDITIGDAMMEATVLESGYYAEYKVEFTMKMNVSGIDTDCRASVSIRYDEPGSPVEITPPEGYKDYPELEV